MYSYGKVFLIIKMVKGSGVTSHRGKRLGVLNRKIKRHIPAHGEPGNHPAVAILFRLIISVNMGNKFINKNAFNLR